MSKRKDRLDPVHPGDVLRENFMKPLGLSAYAVAKTIGTTPTAIREIIRRKRADYDLELARDRSEAEIFRRVRPLKLTETVLA